MSKDKVDSVVEQLKDILQSKATSFSDFVYFDTEADNKGAIWIVDGFHKQLVYRANPDRFFLSENIEMPTGKALMINGVNVVTEKELGQTITKSSLKEVGRLRKLDVDGSFSVNQYMFYNAGTDSLSIGTETPHATFTVADGQTEIVIGSQDYVNGMIGTYNSSDLSIVTDNKTRITVGAQGHIDLGVPGTAKIKVSVHGSLGVNTNAIDSRVALDVGGAIKFNNVIHIRGTEPPHDGTYNKGDVVWNVNPDQGSYMGWVCTRSGTPGIWNPFGEIK